MVVNRPQKDGELAISDEPKLISDVTGNCTNSDDLEKQNVRVLEAGGQVNGTEDLGHIIPSNESIDIRYVEWDGDSDLRNPMNWKKWRKWVALGLVSGYTFMSPLTSSILAPSLHKIGLDLNIESESEQNLCLSIFVLGFTFGPLLLAPLSEMYGRAIILQLSNVVYFAFNLACGFAKNGAQLITFRLFAGLGGSASLVLGSGVISDLFPPEERGVALGIYTLFPLLGPALGPICGGFITEYTTWRWSFWGTTIADFPILILGFIFLEETYSPIVLLRIKRKLVAETGDASWYTRYEVPGRSTRKELQETLMRPLILMATQLIVLVIGVYMAYVYGIMYIVLTTFPKLWTGRYGQSISMGSLNYISLGIGFTAGIQISSPIQDRIYIKLKKRNNDIGLPEFSIPLLIPVVILLPIGLIIYGWTAEYTTHWIFPNIGAALFGAGIMIGFNTVITYIVDAYPLYAASANAAASVLRNFTALVFPLFAPKMYDALGYGWGNTVLAFVAILIGIPLPVYLWFHGARLRARSTWAT